MQFRTLILRENYNSDAEYEQALREFDAQQGSTSVGIESISSRDLEEKMFPEMNWVVDDLIPEGLTVLAGAPKIGKSFFCWNLALAVSQSGRFLSAFPVSESKNVIYFAMEDPQRQIQKRLKMIQPDELLPDNLQIYTRYPIMLGNAGLESWEKTIKEHDAGLVIIDTLHHVMPQNDSGTAYQQDYTLLAPIQEMVHRLGISMILVTHTRKMVDTENPFNMIQGSVGMQAGCDTMMMLVKEDGDKVLHINGREVLPIEVGVEIDHGVFVATSTDSLEREENKLSDARAEILAVVKEAGEPGITMKGIIEALPQRSDHSLKQTVRRMVDEQIYQPKARGKYYSSLPDEFQSEIDAISL